MQNNFPRFSTAKYQEYYRCVLSNKEQYRHSVMCFFYFVVSNLHSWFYGAKSVYWLTIFSFTTISLLLLQWLLEISLNFHCCASCFVKLITLNLLWSWNSHFQDENLSHEYSFSNNTRFWDRIIKVAFIESIMRMEFR